jgi:hypothetical protein
MHPGWRHQNGGNFRDDVAILQLNQPVPGVQPVALGAQASATVRIIGEGAIRTSPEEWDFRVRQAFLKPVGDAACARAFRHYRGNNGERFDAKRMRCAADVDGRRPLSSACTSDEGGPLLDAAAPTPVLLGVVSWHDRACGGDRRPTVFADIGHYRRFITNPNPIWAPKPLAQNTITGERRPGSTLYCGPPPYDVAPARLFFEWYRVTGPRLPTDSADFLGTLVGRKAAYKVKSRDRGRELGCRIVATNNGGLAESDSPVILIPHQRAKPAYASRSW